MRTLAFAALFALASLCAVAQQETATTTTQTEAKQESSTTAEKSGNALGTAARKTKNALKTAGRKTKQGVATAASKTEDAVQNTGDAEDVKTGAKQGYKKTRPVTLVGCLHLDDGGNLRVRTAKYRDGIVVSTNDDLKAHIGHKVRVKGRWADQGNKAIDADAVEHMDASCVIPK